MKIVPSDTYFWETKDEKLDITKMKTTYIINCIKLTNKMYERDSDYKYPDCYDAMYLELNNRGVDTDFELDSVYGEL
tara:strand:- start:389 stop:619 length:231 start_codon:yes stop_codon:yes gene_type:complete